MKVMLRKADTNIFTSFVTLQPGTVFTKLNILCNLQIGPIH